VTRRLAFLLLVAACARSNDRVIEELEHAAAASQDPVAEALLDRAPRAVPPHDPRRVTIPMINHRLPAVYGKINGHALPLILDSGASLVSVNGAAARATALYLPARAPVRMVSPGFDAAYRIGAFRSLSLGSLEFGRGIATVPTRESRTRDPGHGLDGVYGIVGCSVLSHFRVTFDFVRNEVRLEPHGGPGDTGTLFTPVVIGKKRYWMLVDSGATRVFLDPWAALEQGLIDAGEAALHEEKAAMFGGGRITPIHVPALEVAGRRFENVRGGVVNTFSGRKVREGFRPAGLLGLAGLGKLEWTLDFGARRIRVKG